MTAMPAPRLVPARLQNAFDLVARQVGRGDVPSAVLAVANREGLVRVEAFSGQDAASRESIYLLASISKPITATAVMQLVERGLLVLSAPLQRIIPEFVAPPSGPGLPGAEAVTTWHVLTHTSGVVDMDDDLLSRERPDRARLLEIACTSPLRFVPGSRFKYNSLSFALLGEVIRRLDGRDYPDYLRAQLFDPLGMRDAAFAPTDPARAVAADFPGVPREYQAFAATYFNSIQAPGGGLWGSAADLVAFGRTMLRGGVLDGVRVLGRRFVALMTRAHTGELLDESYTPPRPARYGLGWGGPDGTEDSPASDRAFGHGGATGTRLLVDPEADLVVVYLANRWGTGPELSFAAIQAVYGALED
jgi:CubicO group peptidase (beta-lactamase class C family)